MSGALTNIGLDPRLKPPPVQDWQMIVKHAERFRRAQDALEPWSRRAKECVDMFEGKQWSEADLRKLKHEGRPALVVNKIKPLVNLVLGYHLNNRTDINYLPGNDGTGTADMARVQTQVSKQISEMNQLPYVDTEVFMDGLLTGRGFYDVRMDFAKNMFGDCKYRAQDPFATYLDPDGEDYDINTGNFVMTTRWISPDEIEYHYGKNAADLVRPLTKGMTFNQFPSTLYEGADEISPWRRFGGDIDNPNSWKLFTDQFYNWVDEARRTIRMLDIQHYVLTWQRFFVDLETGDSKPVPDNWTEDKIAKVVMWARQNNEPLVLQNKRTRRLRWTHLVGDIMVFDEWSPYSTFTLVPFFPYFRRGRTRGMVEDLLDPQREINVRRSARQNVIGRSANGGWKYVKGSLDAQMKAKLEREGGRPGFNLEYEPIVNAPPPEQIQPAQAPVSIEQLEKEAEDDLKEISGINPSALGQVDQATVSGRAIEARQQQTTIGLEGFLSNYHRTKQLTGRKQLEIVQNHYTEQRIIRVVGTGTNPLEVIVNQASARGIVNDITFGNYTVAIDETSMSKSFLEGQFNELMSMKQIGMPIPDDFLVDASSIGRKEELRAAMAQARQQQAAIAAQGAPPGGPPGAPGPPGPHGVPAPHHAPQHASGPGPGGSKVGPDGGSIPNGPEPGAPPLPTSGPMGSHP